MLKLKNITKEYVMPDENVRALTDVSVSFRKSEFVAILGPSGCGKTTMLNIVGGLDRYTSGDLVIGGVSTKEYKDRDWDNYRNHSIGFVFQSYNLIPHQTILSNVALALTIAGVDKNERIERAKKALDTVGLKGQYNKHPNQLSGGQMQRVAIARALVNDPEIILADEPTGALDTKTSIQVMDLLKEVASDRLVIMVTHNPELAEKYATRTIRLLDGKIVDDSSPYSEEDEAKEVELTNSSVEKQEKEKKRKKAKMSLWTTFKLSFQNLLSKKARTIMTAVAGAIGIIGVSLVLAMSFGVQTYINNMQNDMLSGNPITISKTTFDMSALTGSMTRTQKHDIIKENGYVGVNSMVSTLVGYSKTADSLVIKNEITDEYVNYVKSIPESDVASIYLDYDLDIGHNVFTEFKEEKADDEGTRMSVAAVRNIYISVLEHTLFDKYSSYVNSLVSDFAQMPAGEDYILEQYDVVSGKVATEKNEIMIVLDSDHTVSDVVLAQLGYYAQDEFLHLVYEAASNADPGSDLGELDTYYSDPSLSKPKYSYEELMGKTFTYYPNDAVYPQSGETFAYKNIEDPSWNSLDATKGLELTVVGIVAPKPSVSYGCMESGFYYTEALSDYIIERNATSAIVQKLSLLDGEDKAIASYNIVVGGTTKVPAPNSIMYTYSYRYAGQDFENIVAFAGETSLMTSFGGGSSGIADLHTLSLNNVGGTRGVESISIYPKDFTHKDSIIAYLDEWNSSNDVVVDGVTIKAEDRQNVVYNDNLSIVISMLKEFIDIITIALIGFTALSLVVSTFMIAIITYVSVIERVKEIGVIRSLGGRKKDVSRLFTAETAIIGLVSGAFGIGFTYFACAVINAIVSALSPVARIAILPWYEALIMIGVSILLTLISGVFPARAAAKKDPVIALRSE